MTIANQIGKLLPKFLFQFLQPKYHFIRSKNSLMKRGGKYNFNKDYGGWVLQLPMPNKNMQLLARSHREFARIVKFGNNPNDLIWKWINWIDKDNILYDIGSANGLEGFSCYHLRSSTVYFIEPYTPSIETILKNIFILKQQNKNKNKFEVIHAACTDKEDYKRLSMHDAPFAGETKNTYGDRKGYDERKQVETEKKIIGSQWIKGITIDSVKYNYKLSAQII